MIGGWRKVEWKVCRVALGCRAERTGTDTMNQTEREREIWF